MIKNLFTTLCLSMCVFLGAQSFIPNPPSLDVKSFILIEPKTNTIIASFNEDAPIEPASMTKVMSCLLYTSPSPRDLLKSRMPSSA